MQFLENCGILGGPNTMPIRCLRVNQEKKRQSERNGDWQITDRGLPKISTNPEAKKPPETILREHKSRIRRIRLKPIRNHPGGTSNQSARLTPRTMEVA